MPIIIILIFIIVMVIVVPNVMKCLDIAKGKAFESYSLDLFSKSYDYVTSQSLSHGYSETVFDDKVLDIYNHQYSVCITSDNVGNIIRLFITDGSNYCYDGVTVDQVGIQDAKSSKCPIKYVIDKSNKKCTSFYS